MNTKALMSSRRLMLAGVAAMLGMLDWPGVVAADPPCAITSTSVLMEPQSRDHVETFGSAVAIDGDWAAVGVPGGVASTDLGRVELFHRSAGRWAPAGILQPSQGSPGSRFGRALSMRGEALLVGANYADGNAPTSGAAYVFRLSAGQWCEEATLLAEDGGTSDHFGWDVALDGDWAVVGAPFNDGVGDACGAVYVFRRVDGRWSQGTKLTPADAADEDKFGHSVEMDDGIVAVGIPGDDGASSPIAGGVRIFEEGPSGWTQTADLNPDGVGVPSAAGLFGLVMNWRGGTLVVVPHIGGWFDGALLEFVRTDGRWSAPRLGVVPGGMALLKKAMALAPSGDIAVWTTGDDPADQRTAIVRRDAAGWYANQYVDSPASVPGVAGVVACDDRSLIVRGSIESPDGVKTRVVFVADLPPRDVDQDGLDDACEIASGLADDCDGDGIIDDAQAPYRYVADNIEDAWFVPCLLTISTGGHVLILNHFAVTGSDSGVVRSIGFVPPDFGDEPIDAAIAVVYADPNGDGNPADAALLSAQPVVFPDSPNPGLFVDIPIAPVEVGPPGTSFFVGFAMTVQPWQIFTACDNELPHRQSGWIAVATGPLDLADLSLNPPQTAEFVEQDMVVVRALPIRVNLTDCDDSARLDSCEIARGELADLDGDQIPDICEPPATDLDGDGAIDGVDVGILLGAWGPCRVQPTSCAADINDDGVVDGVDLGLLLQGWGG